MLLYRDVLSNTVPTVIIHVEVGRMQPRLALRIHVV